jgi:hypothetical protein
MNLRIAAEQFSFVSLQVREIMVNELVVFCVRSCALPRYGEGPGMCCCFVSLDVFPK